MCVSVNVYICINGKPSLNSHTQSNANGIFWKKISYHTLYSWVLLLLSQKITEQILVQSMLGRINIKCSSKVFLNYQSVYLKQGHHLLCTHTQTHTHKFCSEVKKNDICNNQKTGCLQKVIHDIGECIIDVCGCLDGEITMPSIRDESSNNSGREAVCIL